jgi:hypothetical protein
MILFENGTCEMSPTWENHFAKCNNFFVFSNLLKILSKNHASLFLILILHEVNNKTIMYVTQNRHSNYSSEGRVSIPGRGLPIGQRF